MAITVRNGLTALEAAVACITAELDATEGFMAGLYVGDESWGWDYRTVIAEVSERLTRASRMVAENARIAELQRQEAAHDRACWVRDMRAEEQAVSEYLRNLDS
jgi:hypothetical protein